MDQHVMMSSPSSIQIQQLQDLGLFMCHNTHAKTHTVVVHQAVSNTIMIVGYPRLGQYQILDMTEVQLLFLQQVNIDLFVKSVLLSKITIYVFLSSIATHLSNQQYNICIRRPADCHAVCYYPAITGSFGLS